MKTLIVTGGIGSGKSLVCSYLRDKGIPVYDADSRTKQLYDSCPGMVSAIENAFGRALRDEAGALDRRALSELVFSDKDNLLLLESIVHPAVYRDFEQWRD